MNLEDYYHNIYRLTYITRYDTIPRIKDENVCEHSFLVSAIILKLHDMYKFDLGKALQISTAHDILEAETGDVGHFVKRNHKQLHIELKKAEKKDLKKYPIRVQEGIIEYDKNKSIESKIVHLADSIQVMQYANNEIKLGNNWYFDDVTKNCKKRIKIIKKEIKKWAI